jgi:DNA-binding response OmpR family regulator
MLPLHAASATAALLAEMPVVLVVGEVGKHRNELAKRLRAAGFEVIETTDFAEAKKVLKSVPVDALFLSDNPRLLA